MVKKTVVDLSHLIAFQFYVIGRLLLCFGELELRIKRSIKR